MKSPRRQSRRAALWLLYALDVTGATADEALAAGRATTEELGDVEPAEWAEVEAMVRGARARWDEVNAAVQAVSPRWKISRMAHIDRNILRLGAWEILFGAHAPLAVINGCVDLAKEYGDKGTPGFVNGLLDQLCRDNQVAIR